MAQEILTLGIKWTVEVLSSLIARALTSSAEPSEEELEILRLERIMRRIHAVLEDSEQTDIIDKSSQLRLQELREVAYDAEDAVDEYEYEVLRANVEARKRAGEVFVWNLSYHPKVLIPYELRYKVMRIITSFQEITDDWSRIRLSEGDGFVKRRVAKRWVPIETTSLINTDSTFGREHEKDEILARLMPGGDHPDKDLMSVLPIVGMGGIGKTTLAQMIFNDERVSKSFDFRAWIYVSEDFDIVNLIKKIMTSFAMTMDDITSFDLLCKTLRSNLKGKKFFLVLDDVWNENPVLWNSLKTILVGVGVGKIIVTARNTRVAEIMQTTDPYYLDVLSLGHCQSLFQNNAFGSQNRNINTNLLDMGNQIIEKCKRLPLAVKVLASSLGVEDDEEEWRNILESELWELNEGKDTILPALKLSYDRMPIELRSCFMYLSLFPKDSPLEKVPIIKQWMAQGFLRPRGGKKEEDIGNAYFNEFLQRSILQRYEVQSTQTFIMHDLIHDLAQSVARDEYLLIDTIRMHPILPKTIRHISVSENFEIEKLMPKINRLRTLILRGVSSSSITHWLHNLTCLRTLILEESIEDKLDVISKLKHLRYLDAPHAPKSVYELYHLQTMNSEIYLSGDIGDLINLRHLHGYETEILPQEIRGLTRLQTIEEFTVGAKSSQCKIGHLKGLTNITGSLTIRGLGTVTCSDVTPPCDLLRRKGKIEILRLYWGTNDHDDQILAQKVLDCLQPHPNIKQVAIEGYPGAIFPMWLGYVSFTKLELIQLRFCNCTSLPTLGQLPSLKKLQIVIMGRVTKVEREFLRSPKLMAGADGGVLNRSCYFPSLEFLRFEWMNEWEEWNGVEDRDFPRLRQLEISNCAKLRILPSLSSLAVLKLELGFHSKLLSSCLTRLQCLQIYEYPSDSLRFPETPSLLSLGRLVIKKCSRLRSTTGFGNLASLQELVIGHCPILRIPASEQVPLNLSNVSIYGSPEAERWYNRSRRVDYQMRLPWKESNDPGILEDHVSQALDHARHQLKLPWNEEIASGSQEESYATKRRKQ